MPPPSDSRWLALDPDLAAGGALSVYFSDPIAAVPVREITRPGDNKADPNLETGTYGLVSTCGRGLRSAIVRDRREALFFTTTWHGRRVLAGYYRVGWYAAVASDAPRDFALAARVLRFDANPLVLADVDARIGTRFARPFRTALRVQPTDVDRVLDLLDGRPDGTDRYVEEIDRVERFNARHGGYRYIARRRRDPFSWLNVDTFLAAPEAAGTDDRAALTIPVVNGTPSGWWTCSACRAPHANKARLRQCPYCGLIGTVAPLSSAPERTIT